MAPAAVHRHTVLLVEDYDSYREAVQMYLEAAGYEVVAVADGSIALEQLGSGLRPCVIVLDLFMPSVNGFSFRKAQLLDSALSRIPVIVVSVGGISAEADAAALGLTTFLRKPASLPELEHLVAERCPLAGC